MLRFIKRLFSCKSSQFDDDLAWLYPPEDTQNPTAWDEYWKAQISHGLNVELFDMFCDDREVVKAMKKHNMKTILCAGNGISQEPKALSAAGFSVTVLDFSPFALDYAKNYQLDEQSLKSFIEQEMIQDGGAIEFVEGNILNPQICQGPFDVIIERKTLQSFDENDLDIGMEALCKRLSNKGIFLSHCHDGQWKPDQEPRHITKKWFKKNQWEIVSSLENVKLKNQIAFIITSTG